MREPQEFRRSDRGEDFVGSASKDDALADDVMALRQPLRDSPLVLKRFHELRLGYEHAMLTGVPDTWGVYQQHLDQLERDLESALSAAELDGQVKMLAAGRTSDGTTIEQPYAGTSWRICRRG
jgi:hypothetical protein